MEETDYGSVASEEAQQALNGMYGVGANFYKALADWPMAFRSILFGWQPNHPLLIHYGLDMERDGSLTAAMQRSVTEIHHWLDVFDVASPFILDGGCGLGGSAFQIAREQRNAHILGISIVRQQLELAEQFRGQRGIGNVDFRVANLLKIPAVDETFDGIYSAEVHCHIPTNEKPQLYAELYRVLKPGRRLVIFDGYRGRNTSLRAVRLDRIMCEGWALPPLVQADDLTGLVEQAGFQLIESANITARIQACAQAIRWRTQSLYAVYAPLALVSQVLPRAPILAKLWQYLGLNGLASIRFARACLAQKKAFATDVWQYHFHVFQKPTA